MREVEPGSDAKSGVTAAGGSPSDVPPPSSTRGFIGTNTDAAQAYVPPTTLPETPEPPVPNTKVALSEGVDPRKLPTMPNLKKAAQVIQAELQAEKAQKAEKVEKTEKTEKTEKPRKAAPVIEAPPDSQISAIRRGAGYAPSRSFPAPPMPGSSRASDPIPRATPVKGLKVSVRPPPMAEPAETPTQRRAALILIFLFAALLAVAVYFFLRRAPSPPTNGPAPSASAITPAIKPSATVSSAPAPAPSPERSAAPEPSATSSAATAQTSPAGTGGRSVAPSGSSETPASTPAAPAPTVTPTSAATAAPAASGPDAPKSDRWF